MKKKVIYVIVCIPVAIILLEALLWIGRYRPYRYEPFSIESHPGQNIIADSLFGLALNPGNFTVTINEGHTYTTTHLTRQNRRVETKDSVSNNTRSFAIFGCSYTYGMGVNDDQAFVSQLANRLDDMFIESFAVPGYGTVQGFLQLQQLVNKGKQPAIALFNFADFHLDRNSMTPAYRLHLNIGYDMAVKNDHAVLSESSFPYVILENGTLQFKRQAWEELYRHWKGRETFALINLLQTIEDRYNTRSINTQLNTALLFKNINQYCNKNKIRLIVAGITKSKATSDLLSELDKYDIETVDIGIPFKEAAYNNLPFDSHPNSLAHELMAEKMADYLSETDLLSQE